MKKLYLLEIIISILIFQDSFAVVFALELILVTFIIKKLLEWW